jgi:DNA replication initiation complex subunit (GINS family)
MLNYSTLRDFQKKEMESSAIVKLEQTFYSDAAKFIAEKKKEALACGSILTIKEYENIRKIVATIQARREEKIVLMAVRGEKDSPGLTSEENALLSELAACIDSSRKNMADVWNGNVLENTGGMARKVRILKDIEAYTGLDKAVYGPFQSGKDVIIPLAEAEWLLKSKLAEVL